MIQRERVEKEMKNMLLCLEFNKTMSSVYVHILVYPVHQLLSLTLTNDYRGGDEQ